MKIEQVVLHYIEMEYRTTFRASRWSATSREAVIVEVRADGLVGWGECVAPSVPTYCSECAKINWLVLKEYIVPAMLGAELGEIDDYHGAVEHVTGHHMAKAGFEMALWDLAGKRDGVSLQAMLGGSGDRVNVGVSVGIQETPEKLLERVNYFLGLGYRRVKLKIGPGRDVCDVAIVRREHPGLMLQADANSAYKLADVGHLRQLEEYGLVLLEQPLANDDIIDHATLQRQLAMPICLDESIHSVDDTRKALEIGACRIINIKPGRVGGLREAKRIHDYCLQRNIPVWMGGMAETGIGRAANVGMASLPGFTLPGDISASSKYFFRDIVEKPFAMNADSTLCVPREPGLGMEVDAQALQSVRLACESFC